MTLKKIKMPRWLEFQIDTRCDELGVKTMEEKRNIIEVVLYHHGMQLSDFNEIPKYRNVE